MYRPQLPQNEQTKTPVSSVSISEVHINCNPLTLHVRTNLRMLLMDLDHTHLVRPTVDLRQPQKAGTLTSVMPQLGMHILPLAIRKPWLARRGSFQAASKPLLRLAMHLSLLERAMHLSPLAAATRPLLLEAVMHLSLLEPAMYLPSRVIATHLT